MAPLIRRRWPVLFGLVLPFADLASQSKLTAAASTPSRASTVGAGSS